MLENPASFDLAAINRELESPSMLLIGHGFNRRLTDLVYRLTYNPNVRRGRQRSCAEAGLRSGALLRKHKGSLRLTRAGAAAREAHEELWNHLADKLVPAKDGFATDATLLLLLHAATSANAEIPMDQVANALTELGCVPVTANLRQLEIATGCWRWRSFET